MKVKSKTINRVVMESFEVGEYRFELSRLAVAKLRGVDRITAIVLLREITRAMNMELPLLEAKLVSDHIYDTWR